MKWKPLDIPKVSGIYTITNTLDEKLYVGYAVNMYDRNRGHRTALRWNRHGNNHLQYAWNLYGEEVFRFEVLVECEEQFLCSEEHYWATLLNVHDDRYGYNIEPTHPYGNPRIAEETKRKISIKNTGKRHTEETLKRMSESKKGRTHSEETKQKMAKSAIGNTRNLGRKQSTEQILKVRKTAGERNGKPIVILSLTGEYITEKLSMGEVAEFLGCPRTSTGNIQSAIKGTNGIKSVKGHILVYKTDYDPNKKYSTDFNKRKIEQYDLQGNKITEYSSSAEAARSINVSNDTFGHAIHWNRTTPYKGYIWKKVKRINEN